MNAHGQQLQNRVDRVHVESRDRMHEEVSAGCQNCYAERMAKRLHAMGAPRYANGFESTTHDDLIDAPRSWKAPRVVFVNSMSDLFHDDVPPAFIEKVFLTMRECPRHTFQILTKRSARVPELFPSLTGHPNIWMGVSVEDSRVVHRVRDLHRVPAAVRFLSLEPLIGAIDDLPLDGIDWAIVGGEERPSGAGDEERMGAEHLPSVPKGRHGLLL